MKVRRSPIERRLRREYLRHKLRGHRLAARWLIWWRENAPADELRDIEERRCAARGAMDALWRVLADPQLWLQEVTP